MSAVDTAQRVIEWAMTMNAMSAPPPLGDVRSTEQLAQPPESLCRSLGELTTITAARMRLGAPPLGDREQVGLGSLIIAAAIGVSSIPEFSRIVLSAVPQSESPVDWVARHGIVLPALSYLTEEVADDCRILSPLTALINRPVKGYDDQAIDVARFLLENKHGRVSLVLHLARPIQDLKVREWRNTLLDLLRLGKEHEKTFVLDVYEAMMIHHQQEAIDQVRNARTVMTDPKSASDENRLRDALSVCGWWGPLWTIERSNINALRARPYLGYAYREGMALYQMSRKLTGGAY